MASAKTRSLISVFIIKSWYKQNFLNFHNITDLNFLGCYNKNNSQLQSYFDLPLFSEGFMQSIKNFASKENTWKTVGLFGLVLIIIKLFIGQNPSLDSTYILFFSFLASACIWLGVYFHQPYPPKGWYMLAIGQFFDSIGKSERRKKIGKWQGKLKSWLGQ